MTKIANPIYDVVFKYLMSDNKIDRLMLSNDELLIVNYKLAIALKIN